MINKDGFRKDNLAPFFNQIALSVLPESKQVTPFIVDDGKEVKKCSTLDELLEYKDEAEVLQAWPGAKRSDVFYFTVKDIREHLKKGGK